MRPIGRRDCPNVKLLPEPALKLCARPPMQTRSYRSLRNRPHRADDTPDGVEAQGHLPYQPGAGRTNRILRGDPDVRSMTACSTSHLRGWWPLLTAGLAFSTGCSWSDSHGTRHTLVLGVGWIRSASVTNAILVREEHILGAMLGTSGIAAGYSGLHTVSIDPQRTSNALLSVHSRPLSLDVRALGFSEHPDRPQALSSTE